MALVAELKFLKTPQELGLKKGDSITFTALFKAEAVGEPGPGPSAIPPPDGMVAWWPGDGNAQDIVGGNHGVLQGSADFVLGKVGPAFNLHGTSDAVKLPHSVVDGLGDITFDAWIKTTDTNAVTISGANASGSNRYTLWIGKDQITLYIKGGSDSFSVSTPGINDGNFHHIAWVRRSTGANELYVDGVLKGSGTLPTGTLVIPPNGLWLGQDQDCVGGCFEAHQAFIGLIDEVEIFNRALTDAEIKAIYDAGSAGKIKSKALFADEVNSN